MNFKYYILIFCAQFIAASMFSQDYSFKDKDFTEEQVELSKEDKAQDGLIIFQDRRIEVFVDGESVRQFYLNHEQILVNSNKAIKDNNRIYIGVSRNSQLIKNKNRVILPNGKTIELSEKDIHEEVDEETGYKYQYYAVKGLEKGAIIEKLYIKEEVVSFSGRSIFFQKKYPIKKSTFQLISPTHLFYKYKSYNDLPEATMTESESGESQTIEIVSENIAPFPSEEKLANLAVQKQKFRYKLFENKASGKRNFYSYNEFAKNVHDKYNIELTKQEKSELKTFFQNIYASSKENLNILEIENRIKNSIQYDTQFEENESIIDIIKNQKGQLFDFIFLFRKSFEYFGIESEIVFTANRYEYPFDLEFETTSNIQDVLFYFPNSEQYLDIKNISTRSPLIPAGLSYTDGIKLKEVKFSGNTMATTEPVFITIKDDNLTTDTMQIKVDFSNDMENPSVHTNIQFGGYSNIYLQPYESYLSEQEYKEVLLDVCKSYTFGVEIDSVYSEFGGVNNIGKENFVVDLKYQSKDFLQKAGAKYLYKVGQVIGQQDELYTERERTLPVELEYKRSYNRYIEIKLPEGYKVSNPEILNVRHELKEDGKVTAFFTSEYKIEGDTLLIENKEGYRKINYSLENFKVFREIYNAAADFNKLTLVLEKI